MQAQLPGIYVSMFEKLTCKILLKNKVTHPSNPISVKVLEIMQKGQIIQCFTLWFTLLIFQPCSATNLSEISVVSLNNHPKRFLK